MKKNITINGFSDGLVQSLNPMSSKQTNLQNCLNGTYITNDGDEFILQNDMGNSRVYQIKLDPGYSPVGMCSYGGVTYIASYNPLTNKSQIGSFPSPQETSFSYNWGNKSEDNYVKLGNTDNTQVLQKSYGVFYDSDTIIRPGDKFDLFVNNKNSNYVNDKLVSYVNNTITDESGNIYIKSPKNKAVTIKLCVADSNGVLHDITPTLQKFDFNGNSLSKYEDLEINNNQGTFFQIKNINEADTEGNKIVDSYDYKPQNIYNSRISGNLFLVFTLNIYDSVDMSLEFFRGPIKDLKPYISLEGDAELGDNPIAVEENKLDILVSAIYRYNAPDGYYDSDPKPPYNTKYQSLYGIQDDFYIKDKNYHKVLTGIKIDSNIYITPTSDNNQKTSKQEMLMSSGQNFLKFDANNADLYHPKYAFDTNLYSSYQRYLIKNIDINDITKDINDITKTTSNLKLTLTPYTIYGPTKLLSYTAEIDINKLNSGYVNITEWRYFVESDKIRLSWALESYPFTGTRLSQVRLNFYDLSKDVANGQPDYIEYIPERSSYFGTITTIINNKLLPKHIYCVKITYKVADIINNVPKGEELTVASRILLNTTLYNDLFSSVSDFCKLDDTNYKNKHELSTKSSYVLSSIDDNSTIKKIGSELNGEQISKNKSINIDGGVENSMQLDTSKYPFDITNQKCELQNDDFNVSFKPYITNNTINAYFSNSLIHISGNIYSTLSGETKQVDVNFTKALEQYFPPLTSNDPQSQERCKELFGYSNVTKKNENEIDHPLQIAYGLLWRNLSGHLDHHGVKYIEINRTTNTSFNSNTMKDLHYDIFGSYWDHPEVMHATDGKVTFYIKDIVQNQDFINYYSDVDFIYFHTVRIGDDPKTEVPIYLSDEKKEGNINGNVANWVVCDRQGVGNQDYYISMPTKQNTPLPIRDDYMKDLLFWKSNGKLYYISRWKSPYEFCNQFKDIYAHINPSKYKKCNILTNLNYTSDYTQKCEITVKVINTWNKTFQNNSDYDDTYVVDNVGNVKKGDLYTKLEKLDSTDLFKYVQFKIDDQFGSKTSSEASSITISIDIPMEGMEDVAESIRLLSQGTYTLPVLLDPNGIIYTNDSKGKEFNISQIYGIEEINKEVKINLIKDIEKYKNLDQCVELKNNKIEIKKSLTFRAETLLQTSTNVSSDSQTVLSTGNLEYVNI